MSQCHDKCVKKLQKKNAISLLYLRMPSRVSRPLISHNMRTAYTYSYMEVVRLQRLHISVLINHATSLLFLSLSFFRHTFSSPLPWDETARLKDHATHISPPRYTLEISILAATHSPSALIVPRCNLDSHMVTETLIFQAIVSPTPEAQHLGGLSCTRTAS